MHEKSIINQPDLARNLVSTKNQIAVSLILFSILLSIENLTDVIKEKKEEKLYRNEKMAES